MKEVEKSLDSQLWHAWAGGMIQIPPVNSKVVYFPQGHAEHALTNVDFSVLPMVPALILSRVSYVKFMAEPETDEVFAKIGLTPVPNTDQNYDDDYDGILVINELESIKKLTSFAKTLTQSDANNGGGFSVPRYCAETIFPKLDYTADPPVQTVIVKDVQGQIWKFRHIYRGTPRRHLLTTGWSNFVNQKKLVAGDSIVFTRAHNGDLCIGIRRLKRGGVRGAKRGKVGPESVIKATALAASGEAFEVVYYPRASIPEFCVKASVLSAAMSIHWCEGMRFKMAFETEDSSRISWFMGTITCVQVSDRIRWPNSPWRLLQVTWDELDLLQNVKRVNPWLVELASNNMPAINLSPFSPPRKKSRLPQNSENPFDGRFSIPSFSNNPLRPRSPFVCLLDNIPAGIQGARHSHLGIPLPDLHPTNIGIPLPDLHPTNIGIPLPDPLTNKLQLGLFPSSFQPYPHADVIQNGDDNVLCSLTMGNNSSHKLEKTDNVKAPSFLLFGQPILTEQQIFDEALGIPNKSSSNGNEEQTEFLWGQGFDFGQCKVFLQSENVGRNLDLSVFKSYEELYMRLANIFGIEISEKLSRVLYIDAMGAIKQLGAEPFSEFMRTAKRLTILMDSGSNNMGRNWIPGLPKVEHGLNSSNPTGPLSIFV